MVRRVAMLIQPTIALLQGFLLDLLLGDPRGLPHIIKGMGKLIASLESALRSLLPKTQSGESLGGVLLVIITVFISTALPGGILFVAYRLSPWLGMEIEAFLCWQLLAAKDLKVESMAVYRKLLDKDLTGARQAVSMIVGRDTERLDEGGVTRAAVETVAENTSDGVIAPLFYMMLGGAVLGCLYKAVNTMDSMIGYKNEKYLHFGRAAAKLDDILNFIPARLAAWLMMVVCRFTGLDGGNARKIYKRDRKKHESPNSAHTEAVCAGALGVRLGGDAWYFGERHRKPFIGDNTSPVEPEDIPRANRLMLATALMMLVIALIVRIFMGGFIDGAL
jgi:adenosylcobinamide-phosphate synthase